jgi:hypothetical protein
VSADDRAAYIEGLRQLADALEQHEIIPLPTDGRLTAVSFGFLGPNKTAQQWEDKRAERARVAALLPCELTEETDRAYSRLVGRIGGSGGLRVDLTAFATGPPRFCPSCGGALPGHTLTCPLIPAGPEHPAGPQAATS